MALKVHKRSIVLNNLLMFILSSIVFVHIMESFSLGVSAINKDRITSFFINHFWIVSLMFVTLLSVLKMAHFSRYLIAIFFSLVIYSSFTTFLLNFDKLILTYIFIYIAVSGYFILFWVLEMKESVYCPRYVKGHIKYKSLHSLEVQIEQDGKTFTGFLTNWDIGTCFVSMKDLIDIRFGVLNFKVEFEGYVFSQSAELITSYDNGAGFRFLNSKDERDNHNWNDFYTILKDRGYKARNIS